MPGVGSGRRSACHREDGGGGVHDERRASGRSTTLEDELSELETLILVLSTSPFLADSDQRSETGGAVGQFKTVLRRLPHADSLYVGYDNGCWLQIRGVEHLSQTERERIDAPAGAAFLVSLVRPTAAGELPLRRVFQDEQEHKIAEREIPQIRL